MNLSDNFLSKPLSIDLAMPDHNFSPEELLCFALHHSNQTTSISSHGLISLPNGNQQAKAPQARIGANSPALEPDSHNNNVQQHPLNDPDCALLIGSPKSMYHHTAIVKSQGQQSYDQYRASDTMTINANSDRNTGEAPGFATLDMDMKSRAVEVEEGSSMSGPEYNGDGGGTDMEGTDQDSDTLPAQTRLSVTQDTAITSSSTYFAGLSAFVDLTPKEDASSTHPQTLDELFSRQRIPLKRSRDWDTCSGGHQRYVLQANSGNLKRVKKVEDEGIEPVVVVVEAKMGMEAKGGKLNTAANGIKKPHHKSNSGQNRTGHTWIYDKKRRDDYRSGKLRLDSIKVTQFLHNVETICPGAVVNPKDIMIIHHPYCQKTLTMTAPLNLSKLRYHLSHECNPQTEHTKRNPERGTHGIKSYFLPVQKPQVESVTVELQVNNLDKIKIRSKATAICCGITVDIEPKIKVYLTRSQVSGGGGISVLKVAKEMYPNIAYKDLNKTRQDAVLVRQTHGHQWRNDHLRQTVFSSSCLKDFHVVGSHMSVVLCAECTKLLKLKKFKNALNKPMPKDENFVYLNSHYRNEAGGLVMACVFGIGDVFRAAVRLCLFSFRSD